MAGCLFTGRYFARNAGSKKAASLERWLRFFLQFLAVPAFAAGLVVLIGEGGGIEWLSEIVGW